MSRHRCAWPGCNAPRVIFSDMCRRHTPPVISEGERECDECGCTFTPETTDPDDTYCAFCVAADHADREYQFMEGYR